MEPQTVSSTTGDGASPAPCVTGRRGASDVREVRRIEERCTIDGVMFSPGDFLVRIGTYYDRRASDTSGLTFEEWTPPDGKASFTVNATELRGANFTVAPIEEPSPVEPPPAAPRRGGRERRPTEKAASAGAAGRGRGAVVTAPQEAAPPAPPAPKVVEMDPMIDDTIRKRCW